MSKRENYEVIRYGNKDGEIRFGHIHVDNNQSSVMLRSGSDYRHYMTMDSTGDNHRKGGTIHSCPGAFQVKCGSDVKENNNAGVFIAENGDIVISARKGRIRIEARNIELIAQDGDNKNGNITLKANEKIILDSKNIDCKASEVASFVSSGSVKVVGDALLNLYGGLSSCVTGASQKKPSKLI
jgi:hypothetical protein